MLFKNLKFSFVIQHLRKKKELFWNSAFRINGFFYSKNSSKRRSRYSVDWKNPAREVWLHSSGKDFWGFWGFCLFVYFFLFFRERLFNFNIFKENVEFFKDDLGLRWDWWEPVLLGAMYCPRPECGMKNGNWLLHNRNLSNYGEGRDTNTIAYKFLISTFSCIVQFRA